MKKIIITILFVNMSITTKISIIYMRLTVILVFMYLATISVISRDFAITYEANSLRNEDVLLRSHIQLKSFPDYGNNLLWDFSSLSPTNKTVSVKCFISDSLAIIKENRENRHYEISPSQLLLTQLANIGKNVEYTLRDIDICYPLSFGDSVVSYFYGKGTFDRTDFIAHYGRNSHRISAEGRMITPDGDSLQHVLLVKKESVGAVNISHFSDSLASILSDNFTQTVANINYHLDADSIINYVENLRWYARGYRYPIIESRKVVTYRYNQAIDSIFECLYYAPTKQKMDLNFDQINDSLRMLENDESLARTFNLPEDIKMLTKSSKASLSRGAGLEPINMSNSSAINLANETLCSMYPEIVTSGTTIYYQTPHPEVYLSVGLYTADGRMMQSNEIQVSDNCGQLYISTNELTSGNYILKASLSGKIFTFKLVKR